MSDQFFLSPAFGGGGGDAFDDVQANLTDPISGIQSIAIRAGTYIDQISITYVLRSGRTNTQSHGGTGGNAYPSISFAPEETIVGISGRSGIYIDQLSITTQLPDPANPGAYIQKTYGPWGGGGGDPFVMWGDVNAFFGRSGGYLDNLGCYVSAPMVGRFGGAGGNVFADPEPSLDPPIVAIETIVIYSDTSTVYGITTTYKKSDGTTLTCAHGGNAGSPTTIPFNPGEKILAVVGRSGAAVDSLAFLTIQPDGTRNTYGPFGGTGGDPFIVNAAVEGFFGRSGSAMDAIGFYTSYPPTANITVFGTSGYLYTILDSTEGTTTSTIPVAAGSGDLSILVRTPGDAPGVSITVADPGGNTYLAPSNGTNGYYAAGSGPGLRSFYVDNPTPGNWLATVTAPPSLSWAVVASVSPPAANQLAATAFNQLSPSERLEIQRALAQGNTQIPAEFCYFCQAQMMAIMGLALVTFVFWAGPVTATSAIVLYAGRLLGQTAASWVSAINSAYAAYNAGMTSWNLALYVCQLQGMCPQTDSNSELQRQIASVDPPSAS